MAKHDFESDTLTTHDIMHCVRVYKGVGLDGTITIGLANFDSWTNYTVPARPTGAHRQSDNVWADANVVILVDDPVHGPSFECPREWQDGMSVGFDYITVPRVRPSTLLAQLFWRRCEMTRLMTDFGKGGFLRQVLTDDFSGNPYWLLYCRLYVSNFSPSV